MAEPMVKVAIKMPESLYRALRDHAIAHRTSVTALCRAGARNEIERRAREARGPAASPTECRVAVVACLESIVPALIEHHADEEAGS